VSYAIANDYAPATANANANAIAIESLKIELEGWARDPETKEPDEKSPVPAAA